jgi:Cu-Zn family superoxide dismutase
MSLRLGCRLAGASYNLHGYALFCNASLQFAVKASIKDPTTNSQNIPQQSYSENTMTFHKTLTLSALAAAIATLGACASLPAGPKASADLMSKSNSSVKGNVQFVQLMKGVQVSGTISGLKPNQEHGFHVHDKGDCSSPDGMSTGGHFNPESKKHGNHDHSAEHHAGDMPNLKADASGVATFKVVLHGLTVDAGATAVKGRAVIVHANPDDYTSQPVGNAGGRLACGLIQ